MNWEPGKKPESRLFFTEGCFSNTLGGRNSLLLARLDIIEIALGNSREHVILEEPYVTRVHR